MLHLLLLRPALHLCFHNGHLSVCVGVGCVLRLSEMAAMGCRHCQTNFEKKEIAQFSNIALQI